eukprot:TRINITY_DN23840_c0_g1_i5.p2 TRINITY_DN23840_c0_g1~~TRINITY_DN23840_c0_g1_i5.p2  ORF type:complete len:102 (-),score=42.71 TRINITY_DN23840_c0_g1_i5:223-528(-)
MKLLLSLLICAQLHFFNADDAFSAVAAEIEAAVKAGKITQEQAKEKFAYIEKEEQQTQRFEGAAARIKAAVKAGKITKETLRKKSNKLSALKQRLPGSKLQ